MLNNNDIPTRLFSNIIPNVVAVLQHAQSADGVITAQAKQALLQATNDLKGALAHAKDYATTLPGGDLNFEQQDELVLMLEKMRDHKRLELAYLSGQAADVGIEVDSTASTPFGS